MKTGFTLGMFVTLQDSCNLNCKFCQFPNKPEFLSGRRIDKDKFLGMID
jgi:2-iminoacetate synthase ThiH